eukprot:s421_g29.t4
MDQAKLCSFREIEKWVQHLFLSHDRSQPPGFAAVTLQQIIECDKQMFIRASNNLVGNVQAEPGAKETPLDKELQTLRTSPELLPYLMPMQTKAAVKPSPNPNQPTKRLQEHGKGYPNKYRKGKGKGKSSSKGKSKGSGLDLPPGCVAKTPEGKPLCFAFNRGVCGYKGTGPRTWHTPEEFVAKALMVTHPMDNTSVSSVTLEAIQFVVGTDPRLVEIERKKNLLKAKIRAKQLEKQEQDFHESLAAPVQKVVKGKKLLLWKQLLEELDYDDLGVIPFMTQGVPLVGAHDHPEVYPIKIKPAALTEGELRDNARYSRRALIARRPQTEEPGFAAHLVETASEEKDLDFLEGPFRSEEEVTNYLGHSNWRVIRRFVIQQGQKLRPIDDGLEAQINAAYTSTIRLDLQDADYVIAMVLELSRWPGMKWCGKTLDLSKAYKQLPILPDHRDLAVVHFKDESGAPVFYVPNSLMFGSTAAVFAFNRVSRSLWFLINRYLKIPSAVYFDDFPMFAPRDSAPAADETVSDFLDLLGWKHDRTGPKGRPFEFSFDVLGLTLDLAAIPRGGGLVLKNKEGRVEKICQKVEEVKLKGSLSLTDAQELHGLLNFATGYFAGRFLKYACFKIFALVSKDGHRSSGLQRWCEDVLTLLRAAQLRTIPLNIDTRTVVIFTDGSWESDVAGVSGHPPGDPRPGHPQTCLSNPSVSVRLASEICPRSATTSAFPLERVSSGRAYWHWVVLSELFDLGIDVVMAVSETAAGSATAARDTTPMLADYEVVFTVPVWFSPEKGLKLQDLLPWFDIELGFEASEVIFAVSLPYKSHQCPPLSELSSLWAPWDHPLSEDHQVHFLLTDRTIWQQMRTIIGEQAIDLMDEVVLHDNRLQTHLHVHFIAGTSILYHVGMLYDRIKELHSNHEQRIRNLEAAQRADHSRLGVCAETIATQYPALAGPLGLLLTAEDLDENSGPSGPQAPEMTTRP